MKAVRQYLERYSTLIDSTALVADITVRRNALPWHQALVIPAFAETSEFLQRLADLNSEQRSLVILVNNCPAYASAADQQLTQQLLGHIQTQHTIENVREGVTFGQLNSRLDLLSLDITVERSDWLKPLQSGVGFARKVGMDVATALWHQGALDHPWVLSSDADAWWPNDYLSAASKPKIRKGALVLPFRHRQTAHSDHLSPAAALYELSLRYYVLGLRWSGSPWAYHTIGSTQAIHCESYAENRGFPVREAGEDFYLLNKIAKTAPVDCPMGQVIKLSDRLSGRVPFGTGPAVKRITEQSAPDEEFLLYEPDIFVSLQRWHELIPALAERGATSSDPTSQLQKALDETLLNGLHALGLAKALNHCQQQAKTAAQFQRHLWQWFDGFRTLKLVHWLRDHGYPSISYRQWCERGQQQRMPFLPWPTTNNSDMNDITQVIRINHYLEETETDTLPFTGGLQH